jgi:adenine deaminase
MAINHHAPELTGAELQAYLAAGISSDHECLTAAEAKEKLNSGMKIIIRHGSASSSLATLPLPLAGLISTVPAAVVASQMRRLLAAARSLGIELPQPFITLAFMALPVIPALKITDHGLFDVEKFSFL